MARLRVPLADLDHRPDVVRLEHQQAEQVGALRVARAEAAGEEPERLRQPGLEPGREPAQVLGRPQQHQVDDPHGIAVFLGQPGQQAVHESHAVGVLVELVQENGVEQHPRELGGRRIAADRGPRRRGLVAGGDGDQAVAAEVQRRRQRRGEADAAVPVPGVADADGGEDERQRGGGEDVVEGQQRPLRTPFGPLPGLDVAALDPGDRVTGRPLDRGHGHRVEPAALQVPGDARKDAPVGRVRAQDARQVPAQRRGVDHPADLRPVAQAARSQVQEPAHHHLAQRPAVVAEHVVGRQFEPDVAQFLRRFGGVARVRGEEGGVDRPGGDAGQHVEVELRQSFRQVPDQPDLVGGPRPAAGEDEADAAFAIPVALAVGPGFGPFSCRHRHLLFPVCSLSGRGGQISSMRPAGPGAPASL